MNVWSSQIKTFLLCKRGSLESTTEQQSLQDNSLTFCVAACVCVFVMAKSSSTFLDSVSTLRALFIEIRHFSPPISICCVCVQWRYVYLSPGDRAFLGSGRSLVSYARSRDTLENSPVEYPSWQGWISWFQFTIMAVILTLISLLLIPSFSTRCRHGNQTQHKIPMKSAHADLKTLSKTAVARESESIEFLNKTPALCHTGFNGHTLCHSKCYNKDWPLKSSLIMWVNERGTPTVLQ